MATNIVTAANDQVPFTVTGTAVLTGVTKLPRGLTQLDFSPALHEKSSEFCSGP